MSEDRFENWKAPEIKEGELTKYNWLVQHKDNLDLGYKTETFSCPPYDPIINKKRASRKQSKGSKKWSNSLLFGVFNYNVL